MTHQRFSLTDEEDFRFFEHNKKIMKIERKKGKKKGEICKWRIS